VLRSQALSLRDRDFVQAMIASGEGPVRVVFAEILPSMVGLIAANLFGAALYAVLTQSGLEFLGVGDVSQVSWGTMLYWAQSSQELLQVAWPCIAAPGLCIAALGTAFALLNFAVDEVANPRLRSEQVAAAAKPMPLLPAGAPPISDALLHLRGLEAGYLTERGTVRAVKDVNLEMRRGEFLGIADESGCGKSTLAFAVAHPLEIHGITRGRATASAVRALLERVGIARALAVQPALILADEPTSMLDVSIRLDIMNLMLDLRDQEGLSYLFIAHDLAGARYMSDRVAVMYAGHLVEIGPSAGLIGSPAHPYTRLLKSAAPKPDSGLEVSRVEARGEIPDLTQLPPGCPFESRCLHARSEYRAELLRMVEVAAGHEVRCVLYYPELGAPGTAPDASRGDDPRANLQKAVA